jgi:hypothetical protein
MYVNQFQATREQNAEFISCSAHRQDQPRRLGGIRKQQGRYQKLFRKEKRAQSRMQLTGNDPSRMAESAAINKSLSVLGQVVHALNTGAVSDIRHLELAFSYLLAQSRIPYRNSKLTRILQDALGGQSVGLLICNLAPSMKFRQDTLNTLKYASIPHLCA